MPKLNDTQRVLLAHAAKLESGSLYPLSSTIANAGERIEKAIASLIKYGYIEERDTCERTFIYRETGHLAIGLFVTAAGLTAIGITEEVSLQARHDITVTGLKVERSTKATMVLKLLQRAGGATLRELIEATGWLPHTTRAALTGLRKKGYSIERSKRDDQICYSIAGAA